MSTRRLLPVAAVLALLLACQTATDRPTVVVTPSDAEVPSTGGIVRLVGPSRPETLLPLGARGAAARAVLEPVLLGAYQQQPDLTYRPQLIAGDAEVTASPFSVTYQIAGAVHWSDGTPITADDFAFTARLRRDEPGYRLIRRIEKVDRRTVRFTFSRPYGRFRQLFDPVLPAHAFGSRRRWADGPRVASGPFEFDRWERGERIVLKRNENFWGRPAYLDEVSVEFDVSQPARRLRNATLHLLTAPATADLSRQLRDADGVAVKSVSGPDAKILLLDAAQPPLDHPAARAGVAFALDREALVRARLATVQPDARPLQSLVALPDGTFYVPHFDRYASCAAAGEVCPPPPAALRLEVAAAPRELRRAVTRQLEAAGVDVEDWSGPRANVRLVTWRWPWLERLAAHCTPSCPGARRLLARSARVADPAASAALRNAAGRAVAASVPAVPLYQEPLLLAWRHEVGGVEHNVGSGVLWNAGDWFLRR